MDSIAHGLTGALIGYCGFRQRGGRAALWASLAAAEFPDSDIVLSLITGETYLRWHRGPTHSVLLLPFWAALVAWAFWAISGRRKFRLLWAASAAGLASHVVLDWLTSYGTMLLSPFSDARFGLGWVFIVDPYVWAMLGVALWAAIRTQQARVARIGVTVIGAYFLFCGAAQCRALRTASAQTSAGKIAAYPQPMKPLHWTIVRQDGDVVHWSDGERNDTFVQYRDERLLPQAEATAAVKLFRWFAEFPLVEKREENGRTILQYRDLRFRTPMPWGSVREGTFVVAEVVFDERGSLLEAKLVGERN